MKISVYIPSYNQKAYLVEAIDSVLAQTLRPHQLILVDDCSSDGSQEVIAGYASQYLDLITPIYHTQNTGVAQVRVDALNAVTGDYVTYVDGDDWFFPEKLEKEAQTALENPGFEIVFSNYYYAYEYGKPIPGTTWITDVPPQEGDVFREAFGKAFPPPGLFRMEVVPYNCLKSVGFHDIRLVTHEDWDLRIRLTKRYRVKYCPFILSAVRTHSGPRLSVRSPMDFLQSWKTVYDNNRHLLEDVPETDRRMIEGKIYNRLAQLSRESFLHTPKRRHPLRALQYGLESIWFKYKTRVSGT